MNVQSDALGPLLSHDRLDCATLGTDHILSGATHIIANVALGIRLVFEFAVVEIL